jgi:hypothetical protein
MSDREKAKEMLVEYFERLFYECNLVFNNDNKNDIEEIVDLIVGAAEDSIMPTVYEKADRE